MNKKDIVDTIFILAEDVKTILTHEQFETNCYKAEGE